MVILRLGETDSTNDWVKRNARELETGTLVWCDVQRSGRGQRGNSWESAPGKNITASALLRPDWVEAGKQFCISEAVALGVADVLDGLGVDAEVKWPNDIYSGDRKICGILIEHSLLGRGIVHTVAGIGLNVNQSVFESDAPNPVSVVHLTGEENDLSRVVTMLGKALERRIEETRSPELLHREFISRLWRGSGSHPYRDVATGEVFNASIAGIEPCGVLKLRDESGVEREYAFKEVEFLLQSNGLR